VNKPARERHQVSVELVGEVAALLAACIAAGEVTVSRRDLSRRVRRVVAYLEARGHIEHTVDRDLIRPIGIRADELSLGLGNCKISVTHSVGAEDYWKWAIDTVIPMRAHQTQGRGTDRADDEANLTMFMAEKRRARRGAID